MFLVNMLGRKPGLPDSSKNLLKDLFFDCLHELQVNGDEFAGLSTYTLVEQIVHLIVRNAFTRLSY